MLFKIWLVNRGVDSKGVSCKFYTEVIWKEPKWEAKFRHLASKWALQDFFILSKWRIKIKFKLFSATIKDFKTKLKSKKIRWAKVVNQYLPITNWLGHYKVKDDLVADIIAGITIAIMNIPQGNS